MLFDIKHHGAVDGVTGSCHELRIDDDTAVLIDCGLFQGDEASPDGANENQLAIDFSLQGVQALIITHVHIDHVGRLPYLFAAGFQGPVYCSEPSAVLLPVVFEDVLKIGFTRDPKLLKQMLGLLKKRIIALPYNQWSEVTPQLSVRVQPAGHILGSCYVECAVEHKQQRQIAVFSGDLGPLDAALLMTAKPPKQADVVVIESTYGDHDHAGAENRQTSLQSVIEHALQDRGVVLIPAFSIGRTQTLLYELEDIIFQHQTKDIIEGLTWEDIEIIVDSPLASEFTSIYRQLKPYWDAEAQQRLQHGRHPLGFEQLLTINSHKDHLNTVEYLQKTARPSIVIAASGMCSGGRIVNYLKALLGDERNDVLFTGYQAKGTPGRTLQKYASKKEAYVYFDNKKYPVKAGIHTISGYSAHAGQTDLLQFINGMQTPPQQVRVVHGDDHAKYQLQQALKQQHPQLEVLIP